MAVMESLNGNGSVKHSKPYSEATVGEGDSDNVNLSPDKRPKRAEKSPLDTTDSASSSSDSSDDDDFFQIDPAELSNSKTGIDEIQFPSKFGEDAQLASKFDTLNTPSSKYGSGPISPLAPDVSIGSSQPNSSSDIPGLNGLAKQSPPMQVMGKSEGPDDYRIPSSVFERSKSTTPMEWSVASNESLFSIHVGNSSFSRDHALLFGKSGDLTNFSYNPPSIPEMDGGNLESEEQDKQEVANAHVMQETLGAGVLKEEQGVPVNKASPAVANHSASISRLSDGSGTSIRSFAFPILTGEVVASSSVKKADPETKPPEGSPPADDRWFSCLCCKRPLCCFACFK